MLEIRRLANMDRYDTTDGRECVYTGSRAYAIVNGSGQVLSVGRGVHVYEIRGYAEWLIREGRVNA